MARRISLREFQQGLVERLASARSGQAARALLGVRAGNENWLLELTDSGEIVPVATLTPVPLAKPWFRGIANIRGTLHNAIDFSAFQGGEPTPLDSEARLLLPHARHGMGAALLISRALGLRAREALESRPQRSDPRPWVGEEYVDSAGQAWKKLVFPALLAHADFLDAAR